MVDFIEFGGPGENRTHKNYLARVGLSVKLQAHILSFWGVGRESNPHELGPQPSALPVKRPTPCYHSYVHSSLYSHSLQSSSKHSST